MPKYEKTNLFLQPNEAKFISMAIADCLENMRATEDQPWTPEARKMRKEMKEAGLSVKAKFEKITGIKCDLPEYEEGDEDEFLTKES